MVKNIKPGPEEAQNLVEKIQDIAKYQTRVIDDSGARDAAGESLLSRFISMAFPAFLAAAGIYAYAAYRHKTYSECVFLAVIAGTLMTILAAVVLYREHSRYKNAMTREIFVEHALHRLLAERQKSEFFTAGEEPYSRTEVETESFDLSLIGFGKGNIKPEPRPMPDVNKMDVVLKEAFEST